ncbi:MAG: hypothetical protein AMXMBFR82_26180 [Candidatus Hydrogenedentota bacterium]
MAASTYFLECVKRMANVHKDFHGALSYAFEFLESNYGEDGLRDFLDRLGDTVYKPLVLDLKARGLPALEDHWRRIMDLEGGEYTLRMDGDTLVLDLRACPAVHHMRAHDYRVSEHFCEHTRIVNEAICRRAGYQATVEYDQDKGRCVQRFRKADA